MINIFQVDFKAIENSYDKYYNLMHHWCENKLNYIDKNLVGISKERSRKNNETEVFSRNI